MKYKNTNTGAIIDSPCIIKGDNWIEIKKEDKKVKATTKIKAEE